MVASVVINIIINMQRPETDPTEALTDGSSFSDPEGGPGGGPGPADDIVPAGRVYCYSSDEEDKEAEAEQAVPLHQRIKRSRFVSRIQEERIHIHETARSDKLDMEQFQPMMTSETVSDPASIPRVSSLQPRVTRAKRECQAEAECYDDATRYLRKRERRERRHETGRASDYGSLSTLGSSLHKLDLIEQDPKTETRLRDSKRSNRLLSECLTFRRTMTQLRKQTLHLVKDIDDAKKRVEESYAETEKIKAEYDKMNQETEDMISHLKFARSKIKSVLKWKK